MARLFSERHGYNRAKEPQIERMDEALRIGLWNAVTYYRELNLTSVAQHRGFRFSVWTRFLKLPFDRLPHQNEHPPHDFETYIRKWFFDDMATRWFDIFDFVEFLGTLADNEKLVTNLETLVNKALVEENSGYRLIQGQFAPITNEAELSEIREAATAPTGQLAPVGLHIQQALELLSDRSAPDYRNSMKESISAVETLCKKVSRMENSTLGPALDKTAKELEINDHLRDGFKKIYTYTNDDHGIRHGLKDEDHPEQEDARFMLVACSAFVNLITEKARKQGKLPS